MCQPLSIPAAWRGKELFERKDWAVKLASEEVAELWSVLDQPTGKPITELQRDDIPLPICSRMLVRLQQDLEEGSGACLVKGLPLDEFSEDEARRFFLECGHSRRNAGFAKRCRRTYLQCPQ